MDPDIIAIAECIQSVLWSQEEEEEGRIIQENCRKFRQASFVTEGYLRWVKCVEKQREQHLKTEETLRLLVSGLISLGKHKSRNYVTIKIALQWLLRSSVFFNT